MSKVSETNRDAYEVNVTPIEFDGLTPVYEVTVYHWRWAGVCGPAETANVAGLDAVDDWLEMNGYERSSDYGDVCGNGFATAELVVVR